MRHLTEHATVALMPQSAVHIGRPRVTLEGPAWRDQVSVVRGGTLRRPALARGSPRCTSFFHHDDGGSAGRRGEQRLGGRAKLEELGSVGYRRRASGKRRRGGRVAESA